MKLSHLVEEVPTIPIQTIRNIVLPPCMMEKARRGPILENGRITTSPIQLVHIDVLGPMMTN